VAAGENCLLGTATQDNYKTITAACLADGHKLLTEAPLDINIQKQVNILVSDAGMDLSRIVMYQATGGLGYGMEYAYSIMERTRLATLSGDRMLAMPMLALVGSETWKAKRRARPSRPIRPGAMPSSGACCGNPPAPPASFTAVRTSSSCGTRAPRSNCAGSLTRSCPRRVDP
jgi:hypothetical protein